MKAFSYKSCRKTFSLFFILSLFTTTFTFAEGEPGRYIDPIFPVVNITKDISYSQNKDLNGQPVDLMMDMYEPATDTQSHRPILIYMHHGSFQNGARTDSQAVHFCTYFATRGYITVSASYRLGIENLLDPVSHTEAVYRAVQDARSAIRFLRANAVKYGIDTARIYIGGSSAGAISAIQAAYLKPHLVPSFIDQNKLGSLDSGNNAGLSTKVHGVINAFGAIFDTTWITSTGAPIVSVHGERDQVVPYKHSSFGQFSLYGSFYINQRAQNVGIKSKLLSFPDTEHGLQPHEIGKLDTTYRVIREFLYTLVTGKDTVFTSLQKLQNKYNDELSIFPNPANDFITIKSNKNNQLNQAFLFSPDGKQIAGYQLTNYPESQTKFHLPELKNGIYILKLQDKNGNTQIKKLSINR